MFGYRARCLGYRRRYPRISMTMSQTWMTICWDMDDDIRGCRGRYARISRTMSQTSSTMSRTWIFLPTSSRRVLSARGLWRIGGHEEAQGGHKRGQERCREEGRKAQRAIGRGSAPRWSLREGGGATKRHMRSKKGELKGGSGAAWSVLRFRRFWWARGLGGRRTFRRDVPTS